MDNNGDEMLMEIVVPQNPMVDPLAVDDYASNSQGSCSQVISLDSSSDEETPTKIPSNSNNAKESSVHTKEPDIANKTKGNPLAQIKSVISSIESSVNTKMVKVLGNTKPQLKLANKRQMDNISTTKKNVRNISQLNSPGQTHLANITEVEQNTMEDFEMDIPVKKFILYKLDTGKKGQPVQTTTDTIPPLDTKNKITQDPHKSCPSNSIGIQSSNSTGFDLNVSISNAMTTNAIQNSKPNSQLQMDTIGGLQQINPQYNVALGLGLNVNIANNSSLCLSNNPVSLNNVALDVSVNMNNKCEEPLPLATQIPTTLYCCSACAYKSTDPETIRNHICPNSVSDINQASQITESQGNSLLKQTENIYFCSVCSYKTSNINDIYSHPHKNIKMYICPDSVSDINQASQITKSQGNSLLKQTEKIYFCSVCSYKTSNINDIHSHPHKNIKMYICPDSVRDINQASQITKSQRKSLLKQRKSLLKQTEKIYVCSVCSYKTSNINDISSHPHKNIRIVKSAKNLPKIAPKPLEETIYRCSWCTWQTNNINMVGCHICPTKKSAEKSSININNETTPQPKEQSQTNMNYKKYSCVSCSLQSNDMGTIIDHNCQLPSSMKKVIKTAKKYSCFVCSFVATDLISLRTHKCLNNAERKNKCYKVYKCVECNYQTMVKDEFNSRICPASNSSIATKCVVFSGPTFKEIDSVDLSTDKNIIDKKSRKTVYGCTGCPYRTINLEHMYIHKSHCKDIELPEQSNQTKSGTYYCGVCPFNSIDPELMKSHRCSLGNNETLTQKKVAKKQPSKFTCLSCGFTTVNTSVPERVKSHKCQARSRTGRKGFACEICYINFFDTPSLFKHLMEEHYATKKLWTCVLCNLKSNFYSDEELTIHYSMHEPPYPKENKHSYQCLFCLIILEPKDVKGHLKCHIRTCTTWDFEGEFEELFQQFQGDSPNFTKVDNLRSETVRKDLKMCYSCQTNIFMSGIKCISSDCENWYHIQCCNIYSQQLDPHDISNHPDWFCMECNDKLHHNVSTAEENVGVTGFCLDVVDTLLLEQVNKQNSMLEEICKIKEEKLATKEEFKRVKDFIVNSKSEKINTPMVRAVCNVIEKFINAGVDDTNS